MDWPNLIVGTVLGAVVSVVLAIALARWKYTKDRLAYELEATRRERILVTVIVREWVTAAFYSARDLHSQALLGREPEDDSQYNAWPEVPVKDWERLGNRTTFELVDQFRHTLSTVYFRSGRARAGAGIMQNLTAEELRMFEQTMEFQDPGRAARVAAELEESWTELCSLREKISVAVSAELRAA